MKILFTGASSFTGMHIAEALIREGHHLILTCTQSADAYTDIYAHRLQRIAPFAEVIYSTPQGSDRFLEVVQQQKPDILCSHGAYTVNYRQPDFDIATAYAQDTLHLPLLFDTLRRIGCNKIIYTGSIFAGHGSFQKNIPFSPYGLGKRITSETFHFYGSMYGIDVSTFVISNPFGELDNRKMLHIFGEMWKQGKRPHLTVANYIRDNIHVELLAQCYAFWVQEIMKENHSHIFAPSGYRLSMQKFTELFATEMRLRLGWACEFQSSDASTEVQPLELLHDFSATNCVPTWNPTVFWDRLAEDILHR